MSRLLTSHPGGLLPVPAAVQLHRKQFAGQPQSLASPRAILETGSLESGEISAVPF
jgi:hypothetical protein